MALRNARPYTWSVLAPCTHHLGTNIGAPALACHATIPSFIVFSAVIRACYSSTSLASVIFVRMILENITSVTGQYLGWLSNPNRRNVTVSCLSIFVTFGTSDGSILRSHLMCSFMHLYGPLCPVINRCLCASLCNFSWRIGDLDAKIHAIWSIENYGLSSSWNVKRWRIGALMFL